MFNFNFNPRLPRGNRHCRLNCRNVGVINFNPRLPRGNRQICLAVVLIFHIISIHGSREGTDCSM